MTALLSGDADIGLMGVEASIYVYLEGKKDVPKIIGQLTKRDGSFLVSRVPEPNFKWEDLEGKEIIAGRTGGVPAMTFEYVVNKYGLINGKNVTLNNDIAFNLMGPSFVMHRLSSCGLSCSLACGILVPCIAKQILGNPITLIS